MKLFFQQRSLPTVLVILTVLVIITLAMLLYRWSNQVSEATTVRLADSLQMSMVNWHLNLFRELSDICLALRVDSDSRGDPATYTQRFAEWRATAMYPDVVANLYILRPGVSGSEALRLNPDSRRFELEAWPEPLLSVRDELLRMTSPAYRAEQLRNLGETSREGRTFYPPGGALAGWLFEPNAPALIRLINSGDPVAGQPGGEFLVIELDRQVIQDRILPDLARRYFLGVDGLDYLIAVVAESADRRVIYTSDPGFGETEVSDADGRMDVFGNVTHKSFGSPIYVFHKLSENAGLSELAASIGTSWFPLIGESGVRDWQLIVRHRRGGALGAFVAEMHRRDLAIGSGVLLLLVVSVAMLIVTSQRAHRLAELQMGFVTAVSHELRTPLTIISSAAQNVAQGVVEGTDQVKQYGSVIVNQAGQLSRLVEEILLFAATRENRHRYNSKPLDVSDIIDATMKSAAGLIEASRFTLELEVPAGLPRVMGDLAALSQCLQNLITNALKYGGAERWIGVKVTVNNGNGMDRKEVQIHVSDRGMGIDERDLPHIFEPFYRSPAATAAQIHGTGLGLSVAKSIAEAMHGELTVKSQPGVETTFTLHLPCMEDQPGRVTGPDST